LLVAHGSRRRESNDEVASIAGKLRRVCSGHYPIIHYGFLEIAEPMIPEGIKQCVDDGATSIIVLPYFLNSGRHVVHDIPALVNNCRSLYPDSTISIAPHIGASPLMIDLVIASADTHV